ncbi:MULTISPECIES: hypothetical protein [unclassified Corynebacterium]|uniref:hypothetical protein n=1 Tax=unclassified Corynebacterium TaxID=2624378 RepID=UPI0029CA2DB5|nr:MULTISPECIES: hypothetical protein [unclassified Corynebacterium]WPF66944.1 hypothetical protein OLX12_04255 [Corynebacterium sp. 22KM0430]WPF69432.1 hypothetical protein OLW90_04250 [Corynebacterium sp. 21KM1197]
MTQQYTAGTLKRYAAPALLPALAGCAPSTGGKITETVLSTQESFSLSEVFEEPIAEAYVFCSYADEERGEELGFDRKSFYSIDRDYMQWETNTGIGIKFRDEEKKPIVEWFNPVKINSCASPGDSYRKIDPEGPITIEIKKVEFIRYGEKEVKHLFYRDADGTEDTE